MELKPLAPTPHEIDMCLLQSPYVVLLGTADPDGDELAGLQIEFNQRKEALTTRRIPSANRVLSKYIYLYDT